jgi:hypothetical protein
MGYARAEDIKRTLDLRGAGCSMRRKGPDALITGERRMEPALKQLAVLTVALAIVAGCATTGIDTSARMTDDGFKSAKGKHRSDIDVFIDGAPERPYREVAVIRAKGIDKSTEEGLLEAMKIRAARLGADALTDIRFFTEPVTGGPTGSLYCPTWKECRYLGGDSYITSRPAAEATAIVYTEGIQEP